MASYADGTHSLQRIHWWASAKFLQICSDEETNSSTWMAWGWVHFQQIIIFFVWTIPLSVLNGQ